MQPARQAEREKVLGKRKGDGQKRRKKTTKKHVGKLDHLHFLPKSK